MIVKVKFENLSKVFDLSKLATIEELKQNIEEK